MCAVTCRLSSPTLSSCSETDSVESERTEMLPCPNYQLPKSTAGRMNNPGDSQTIKSSPLRENVDGNDNSEKKMSIGDASKQYELVKFMAWGIGYIA